MGALALLAYWVKQRLYYLKSRLAEALKTLTGSSPSFGPICGCPNTVSSSRAYEPKSELVPALGQRIFLTRSLRKCFLSGIRSSLLTAHRWRSQNKSHNFHFFSFLKNSKKILFQFKLGLRLTLHDHWVTFQENFCIDLRYARI